MARLSQKQLDDLAKSRKEGADNNERANDTSIVTPKMINEILGDQKLGTYKYKLPSSAFISTNAESIPFVNYKDFPKLKISGKFSGDRQRKGAPIYLLKEIDHVLQNINEGTNKNATLNFLIWVGLQALKGLNDDINININDTTYADGEFIIQYLKENN